MLYTHYLHICKVEWVKISMDRSSAGHSGFSGCKLAYIFLVSLSVSLNVLCVDSLDWATWK